MEIRDALVIPNWFQTPPLNRGKSYEMKLDFRKFCQPIQNLIKLSKYQHLPCII